MNASAWILLRCLANASAGRVYVSDRMHEVGQINTLVEDELAVEVGVGFESEGKWYKITDKGRALVTCGQCNNAKDDVKKRVLPESIAQFKEESARFEADGGLYCNRCWYTISGE